MRWFRRGGGSKLQCEVSISPIWLCSWRRWRCTVTRLAIGNLQLYVSVAGRWPRHAALEMPSIVHPYTAPAAVHPAPAESADAPNPSITPAKASLKSRLSGAKPDSAARLARKETKSQRKEESIEPATMMAVQALQKQKREEKRRAAMATHQKPPYILLPDGRFIIFRDLLTTIAILYVAVWLPMELGFFPELASDRAGFLWHLNLIIDLVFISDMVLQFVVAYPRAPLPDEFDIEQEIEDERGQRKGGNLPKAFDGIKALNYEFRLSRIALNYLKGWLLLDIASILPSIIGWGNLDAEVDADDLSSENTEGAFKSIRALKVTRAVRVARILKIFRILRILRVLRLLQKDKLNQVLEFLSFPALEDFIVSVVMLHTRKVRILKLIVGMLIIVHYLACLLGIFVNIGNLTGDARHSFWGTHGYCFSTQQDDFQDTYWRKRGVYECIDSGWQYGVCFLFAFGAVFQTPNDPFVFQSPFVDREVSDLVPIKDFFAANTPKFASHEYVAFNTVSLIGNVCGLYLTGAFVDIVLTSVRSVGEEVNWFCKQYNVSYGTRRQLQAYFRGLDELRGTIPKQELFLKLSPSLKNELLLDIHGGWIRNLPFLTFLTKKHHGTKPLGMEYVASASALLAKIALQMLPCMLIAKERAAPGKMYIIVKGIMLDSASKRLLRPGKAFGAVSLVTSATSSAAGSSSYKALTLMQLIYIDRQTLFECCEEDPLVKKATMRLKTWGRVKLLQTRFRRAKNAMEAEALESTNEPSGGLLQQALQRTLNVSDGQTNAPAPAPAPAPALADVSSSDP